MTSKSEERERIEWVFDPLPASGARRGGDPASHVFRQSVSSFVREVVQNANDQRIDAPEVHFRFVELEGESLEQFRKAVAWETLLPHLNAAATTRGGRNLREFLDDHGKRGKLLALVVEDRGSVGLTGDELEGESHFRALCKDTLFSHKQSDSAGGSYGLGKSILWAFSGMSTVLFNSVLSRHEKGQVSPRLFGRAELPSHVVEDGKKVACAGSGWFGRYVETGAGPRAESVWSKRASVLAEQLRIRRSESSGTSIAILGFRDPTSDVDRSADELAQDIRLAIEREFWPAMVMPGRPLVVWVAAGRPSPLLPQRDFVLMRPFVDAYLQRASDRSVLEEPGHVVAKDIEVDLPARRDGKPAVRARVRLCVRLADESANHKYGGHVAWFRGAGMVVRYTDRSGLALGARPFHAVVACGEARVPEAPTESDLALERFLRSAEPPGHDVWESTASLKAEYKPGYAKALEHLKRRVDEELKAIVVAQPRHGKQGPDRLRKRFPLGQKGGGRGGGPSAFHFHAVDAHLENQRWHFRAEVRPASGARSWLCNLRIAEIGEDGSEIQNVPIEHVETSSGSVQLVEGVASIAVEGKVLKLQGTSVELDADPTRKRAIHLELRGMEGE